MVFLEVVKKPMSNTKVVKYQIDIRLDDFNDDFIPILKNEILNFIVDNSNFTILDVLTNNKYYRLEIVINDLCFRINIDTKLRNTKFNLNGLEHSVNFNNMILKNCLEYQLIIIQKKYSNLMKIMDLDRHICISTHDTTQSCDY